MEVSRDRCQRAWGVQDKAFRRFSKFGEDRVLLFKQGSAQFTILKSYNKKNKSN